MTDKATADQPGNTPLGLGSTEGLGVTAPRCKPHYKLVARVSTAEFRRMVASRVLWSGGWTSSYRRAGNTVPVEHEAASLVVFGAGDNLFLCSLP